MTPGSDAFTNATVKDEAVAEEIPIDGISGATVSSKAVARCVRAAVAYATGADVVFLPRMILPNLDGPNLVLISLITLVLDHYLSMPGKRSYAANALYAALIFRCFPWASCLLVPVDAVKLAITGTIIFTVTTWPFDPMMDRISSGPSTKAAPLVSVLGLYLAAQCLMGII